MTEAGTRTTGCFRYALRWSVALVLASCRPIPRPDPPTSLCHPMYSHEDGYVVLDADPEAPEHAGAVDSYPPGVFDQLALRRRDRWPIGKGTIRNNFDDIAPSDAVVLATPLTYRLLHRDMSYTDEQGRMWISNACGEYRSVLQVERGLCGPPLPSRFEIWGTVGEFCDPAVRIGKQVLFWLERVDNRLVEKNQLTIHRLRDGRLAVPASDARTLLADELIGPLQFGRWRPNWGTVDDLGEARTQALLRTGEFEVDDGSLYETAGVTLDALERRLRGQGGGQ